MTRGRPFEPGNKFGQGRPKGSKNKSTSAARQLLEKHHEALMLKNITEGLKNNTKSRLWCLNEAKRGTPQTPKLKLPPCKTLDDVETAFDVVLSAVAKNKCSDARGQTLCSMLVEKRKMIETRELAPRLEALEGVVKKLGSR
jgi:hypothetical protein